METKFLYKKEFLAIIALVFIPSWAGAQNLSVGSNFSGQSYSYGKSGEGRAPISLKQMMSVPTATAVSTTPTNSTYTATTSSYTTPTTTTTTGVPYTYTISPTTATENTAQRDAYAQQTQTDTLAYLEDDALMQTYTQEYEKYQAMLAGESEEAKEEDKPVFTKNTKVLYNTSKTKKTLSGRIDKLEKPKKVFNSNN